MFLSCFRDFGGLTWQAWKLWVCAGQAGVVQGERLFLVMTDGTSPLRALDVFVLPTRCWQYVFSKAKFLDSYESPYSRSKEEDIFRNLIGPNQ